MLFVMAGLPGAGKTTIAKSLARKCPAMYLRIDTIEQALIGLTGEERCLDARGYVAAYAVAEENLLLGHHVVADSVNPLRITRESWRAVAARTGSAIAEIEIVCSDSEEHRRRIESRTADITGHRLPDWHAVLGHQYEAWDREHVVIDTSERSVESCVLEIERILRA